MASYIADAVEIITDDGTGIPSTYSNSALGLASNGHFYLITERFGLSGTPTVTGDTARTVWYEGILAKGNNDFSVSHSCDFVESGNIAAVSGMSFTVKNTINFYSTLVANSVYLSKRVIKYYRVTSTDGLVFNFELRWTGAIDEQPFNELTHSISCQDTSKDLFKSMPTKAVTSSAYPDAPKDSLDKYIPIALGRVAHSPLIGLTGSGALTTLARVSGIDYKVAASIRKYSGSSPYVDLYVPGMNFAASDNRLVGKYLSIISGASSLIRIINSNAYNSSEQSVRVYLSEPLPTETSYLAWGGTTANVWYFQVIDLTPSFIADGKPLYEFIKNASGRQGLYTYDSNINDYWDISDIKTGHSLTNISNTGYPGVTVISKSADGENSLNADYPIVPTEITLAATTAWTSSNVPSSGSCANLFDVNRSTYYTLSQDVTAITYAYLTFDLSIPPPTKLKPYKSLYVLFDMSQSYSVGTINASVDVTVTLFDFYGREITTNVSAEVLNPGSVTGTDTRFSVIPGLYYNDTSYSDTSYHQYKSVLDISGSLPDSIMATAFNRARVKITYTLVNGGGPSSTYDLKIYQVGIVGRSTISTSSDDKYLTLKGETFGNTWNTRKTAEKPILLITDAMEHLVRHYDTDYPVWEASKAYIVGDKVRSTNEQGNIFLCTVAGTSNSSQPSWTSTSGATYTDNTVTWTEVNTIPIDETSFDLLTTLRPDWFIGRALTENKKSEEYYKELCESGFFVSYMNSAGKLAVKSWIDDEAATVTFDEANIIVGSMGDMKLTEARRAYNDFTIKYDYNPGSNKFNKQITIKNVDKPAFPSLTELNGQGADLGAFSITSISSGGGWYGITIATTSPHGLNNGAYISISSNTEGYNLTSAQVTVTGDNGLFLAERVTPTASPSTSGSLKSIDINALKWKEYAGGFNSYAIGQEIWELCRESYKITKLINKLPDNLAECKWFIDPYAKDGDGNDIWDLNVGDDHPAVYYAYNLARWTAWQKRQVTFEVQDSATYSALNIGAPVLFSDAKLTGGVSSTAWIHEKTQLANSENQVSRFRFGVTLKPEGSAAISFTTIIDENGATDIIDENSATNIIDENGA